VSREVVLSARPQGTPQESDFELRDVPDASPADGEASVRNVFISVDPYMRGRMTGVRSYVEPFEVGDPIDGGAVGRVVESSYDGLAPGDWVASMLGWREQGVVPGARLRKLDESLAPPSTALGVLGMPGLTAWVGLVDIGDVTEGETIYVSGAAGAVGSTAAQIAKLKGLRVIGSAGSDEKIEWLRSLGVEAFNYHETRAKDALADGIDVYFDNVGGE
jgi:NADPH:quinone reductase